MKKRKRRHSVDNLIDTSSSDESIVQKHKKIHTDSIETYPLSEHDIQTKKLIQEEIQKRKITMNQVYELELTIDEYIWFWTYINIRQRDNKDTYSEESYDVTEKIYQKYILLKKQDNKQLELKKKANIDVSIVDRIVSSDHSDDVKVLLYKKYKLYSEDTHSEDYAKCIEWIDTVLSLPVSINKNIVMLTDIVIRDKLGKLNYYLSENIYGLDNVKEKIIKTVCSHMLNTSNTGRIITLIGPPGTGKTTVASIIAKAMDKPFDQISFGSIQDSKILTGHSSTYIGAVPGLFTKILIRSQCLDMVILLDEIDKITNSLDNNITSVLFHVLDKAQNHKFRDIYIPETPLDLSKIIFICAGNDLSKIDPVLRDRMDFIHLHGYNINDKMAIARKYMIPKFIKELRFKNDDIILEDVELEYLIVNKTEKQPGMRDVERKLRDMYESIAVLKYIPNMTYDIDNLKFPLKITKNIIDKILE